MARQREPYPIACNLPNIQISTVLCKCRRNANLKLENNKTCHKYQNRQPRSLTYLTDNLEVNPMLTRDVALLLEQDGGISKENYCVHVGIGSAPGISVVLGCTELFGTGCPLIFASS